MKRLLMLMGILVAAACGGDGKPGPGGGGGDLTLGDVCEQIGQVVCDKFADCGGVPPDCERDFKAGCCGDSGDCGLKSQRDQSAVDNCADDIRGLSCSATTIPSSCTGF